MIEKSLKRSSATYNIAIVRQSNSFESFLRGLFKILLENSFSYLGALSFLAHNRNDKEMLQLLHSDKVIVMMFGTKCSAILNRFLPLGQRKGQYWNPILYPPFAC